MKLSELIVYCLDLVQLSTLKYKATEDHVKLKRLNPKLETRNPKLETRNPKLRHVETVKCSIVLRTS